MREIDNVPAVNMIWEIHRMGHARELVPLIALDIAELALPIWEAEYPQDGRLRKALKAARDGVPEVELLHATLTINDAIEAASKSGAGKAVIASGGAVLQAVYTVLYDGHIASHEYNDLGGGRAAGFVATRASDAGVSEEALKAVVRKHIGGGE